jgi:hypothetical protein
MAPPKTKKPNKQSPASPHESGGVGLDGYEPTASEKAAAKRFKQRAAEASAAPRVKVEQTNESVKLSYEHERQGVGHLLLSEALGSVDFDFVSALLNQLAKAAQRNDKIEERDLNFLISVIKDLKPRDQMEAMLAAQIAVVHEAVLTFARRLANVDSIPQQDSAVNAFTKLTRTFTM